jgi:HK97 family phage prohead protease
MKKLVRTVPKGSIRAMEIGRKPVIQLRAITYNVVDSYGSLWKPGCLTEGVRARMPQLAWGHNWSDPIGRALDYEDDAAAGPALNFYLDDFDAVPRARQAYAQVNSGTIDECSVGFGWDYEFRTPTAEEEQQYPGVREVITKAELDEVSLVLRGAVPGAKVLALRSRSVVPADVAGDIIARFAAGTVDLADALVEMKAAAVDAPTPDAPPSGGEPAPPEGGEPKVEENPGHGESGEPEIPEGGTPEGTDAETADEELEQLLEEADVAASGWLQ